MTEKCGRIRVMAAVPLMVFCLAASQAGQASAQERPAKDGKPGERYQGSYGQKAQVFVVTATEFAGKFNANSPDLQLVGRDGLFYFNSPGADSNQAYLAPVLLPAGAHITNIKCLVKDSDDVNDVVIQFVRTGQNLSDFSADTDTLASLSSTGTTGFQVIGSDLDVTIQYFVGDLNNVYYLVADIENDTALRDCFITWNRQISTPEKGTQTFNDVPDTNGAWKAVEALAASGITLGSSCPEVGVAPPTFCLSQNVTRSQMALFLARALGLHWPE